MTRKILMISANPLGTNTLKIQEEIAAIQIGLSAAPQGETFRFIPKTHVSIHELQDAMLSESPQIVHFSGHGAGEAGIKLQDEYGDAQLVSSEALAGLFELFADTIECVLLNACYSEVQATAISQHIPYVIGMNNAIEDNAAREFAVAFYKTLGAGKDIQFAYKFAKNALLLTGMKNQHLLPVLLANPHAAPKQSPTQQITPQTPKSVSAPSTVIKAKIMKLLPSLNILRQESERSALIRAAQFDQSLANQLDANQALGSFVPNTVEILAGYGTLEDGRHALEALLTAARDLGGKEFKQQCDTIFVEWLGRVPEAIAAADIASEPPTPDTPPAKPRSTVNELKRKSLEQQFANYQKQYEAVSQQKMSDLNAMNQIALQNQLDDLERKMQEIEQQLAVL